MPHRRRGKYARPLTEALASAGVDVLDPTAPLPPPMTWAVNHPETFTEAQFQGQLEDLLRMTGWRVHHETDSRRTEGGLPDLICVRPPRLVVLELKAVSGTLTEPQRAWLGDLADCGVEAAVVGPGDLLVLTKILARPGIRLPAYDPGPRPILSPEQVRAHNRELTLRKRARTLPSVAGTATSRGVSERLFPPA